MFLRDNDEVLRTDSLVFRLTLLYVCTFARLHMFEYGDEIKLNKCCQEIILIPPSTHHIRRELFVLTCRIIKQLTSRGADTQTSSSKKGFGQPVQPAGRDYAVAKSNRVHADPVDES